MSRNMFCAVIILFLQHAMHSEISAQQAGSVTLDTITHIDEIIVTATRHDQPFSHTPLNVEVIAPENISALPAYSTDDIFQLTAGINQDRKNGIFSGSKNTLNMMGITGGEQGRVLALEDGIPMNLADNGEVNWNRLDLSDYRQMELIKGPASSLYGSNAMGGIVNLVSENPVKPLHVKASLSYGSYSTVKISAGLMGLSGKFSWGARVMYQQSDGYIMPPDSLRDTTDVPTFLDETSIRLKAGYRVNNQLSVDASYCFYTDKHGYGIKLLDEDGGYTQHPVHVGRIGLKYDDGSWFANLNMFIQAENYYKLIERLRDTVYSAIDVNSDRLDAGVLSYFGKRIGTFEISSGIDLRTGLTDASDTYRTSSDVVSNEGMITQFSVSVQAGSDLFTEKLKWTGSLGYSLLSLGNASFSISDPTSETDYMNGFATTFDDTTWNSFNPALSLIYLPTRKLKIMLAYSHGFRAPTIDDLTRSGMINIGFKEANPSLLPERIDHYALAARYQPVSHFTISGAISYSMGNDYIYYTETGETLFGGRRKVYQRTNLNKVEAIAGELSVEWQPAMWLRVHASTLLNQSIIVSNAVLQGKSLAYAPGHIEAIGIITENNIVNASATIIYKGEQYMDDENSTSIPAQAIVNLKLYRVFVKHYRLSFTAQNLFDVTYLTDGFNLSLGRFLSAGVEVIF